MRLPLSARLLLAACAACSVPRADVARDDAMRTDTATLAVRPVEPAPSVASVDSVAPGGQQMRSVRTSLREAHCETVSVDEESGGSMHRCPGTAGYRLMTLDGDARMSITVVDPSGAEHPLDFWTTVTGAFSGLGDEAEWRVRGTGASAVPVALIVPLNANEEPDDPERVTAYRIVAKVTRSETCVTHRLPSTTSESEVLRLADASAAQPCRTSYLDQQ